MNAVQKVKFLVLMAAARLRGDEVPAMDGLSGNDIDTMYDELVEKGFHWDAIGEVRGGEVETGLATEYDRNYEAKAVATQLPDGSWIGWTYWYGGGKHGNPDEVPWMDDVYELDCQEEEKVVIVRNFNLRK